MPADDAIAPHAVHCTDLSVARSGTRVVEGISLTVPSGGTLAIMGPTGSGKSTLAALLGGAERAGVTVAGGDGSVLGVPLRARGRALRTRRYATGYLPQRAGADLPARLTVAEVVGSPITSRDRRVNTRLLDLRVAALLDELALPLGTAHRYPYELSAGMRQRVALARALVLEPKLFVGDDPFANLDPEGRRTVRKALSARRAANAMAIVAVTNDAQAVRDLDADVLVLRAGRPVGYGRGADDMHWTPDAGARIPT